jgi:hypothetical protein
MLVLWERLGPWIQHKWIIHYKIIGNHKLITN